jgi:hypothetical protein
MNFIKIISFSRQCFKDFHQKQDFFSYKISASIIKFIDKVENMNKNFKVPLIIHVKFFESLSKQKYINLYETIFSRKIIADEMN